MTVLVNNVWPVTIPLPFIDFSGEPRIATISSPVESTIRIRRSRFQKSYVSISVSWRLDDIEYDLFKAFFSETLNNGVSSFLIELKYPLKSDLNWWQVRFLKGYKVGAMRGPWIVSADLDLIMKIEEEVT